MVSGSLQTAELRSHVCAGRDHCRDPAGCGCSGVELTGETWEGGEPAPEVGRQTLGKGAPEAAGYRASLGRPCWLPRQRGQLAGLSGAPG